MAEAPAKEFSSDISSLADQLVGMSVKEAQSLVDCLKDVHGIEPAGGGVVMAAAGGEAEVEEEQTSFTVMLIGAGEKKIQTIKVVRSATSLGLKEAKELVDSAPKAVKENLSKADAEALKNELEEAGAAVEIK